MFNFARTQFSFVWTLEKSDSSNVAFCMFYLTRKIILIGGDDDDEDDQDGEGGDEGGGESLFVCTVQRFRHLKGHPFCVVLFGHKIQRAKVLHFYIISL